MGEINSRAGAHRSQGARRREGEFRLSPDVTIKGIQRSKAAFSAPRSIRHSQKKKYSMSNTSFHLTESEGNRRAIADYDLLGGNG